MAKNMAFFETVIAKYRSTHPTGEPPAILRDVPAALIGAAVVLQSYIDNGKNREVIAAAKLAVALLSSPTQFETLRTTDAYKPLFDTALRHTVLQGMSIDPTNSLDSLTALQKQEYDERYAQGLVDVPELGKSDARRRLKDFCTHFSKNLLRSLIEDTVQKYPPTPGRSGFASACLVLAKDALIEFHPTTAGALINGANCSEGHRGELRTMESARLDRLKPSAITRTNTPPSASASAAAPKPLEDERREEAAHHPDEMTGDAPLSASAITTDEKDTADALAVPEPDEARATARQHSPLTVAEAPVLHPENERIFDTVVREDLDTSRPPAFDDEMTGAPLSASAITTNEKDTADALAVPQPDEARAKARQHSPLTVAEAPVLHPENERIFDTVVREDLDTSRPPAFDMVVPSALSGEDSGVAVNDVDFVNANEEEAHMHIRIEKAQQSEEIAAVLQEFVKSLTKLRTSHKAIETKHRFALAAEQESFARLGAALDEKIQLLQTPSAQSIGHVKKEIHEIAVDLTTHLMDFKKNNDMPDPDVRGWLEKALHALLKWIGFDFKYPSTKRREAEKSSRLTFFSQAKETFDKETSDTEADTLVSSLQATP